MRVLLAVVFFQFLVIECLDPDPHSMRIRNPGCKVEMADFCSRIYFLNSVSLDFRPLCCAFHGKLIMGLSLQKNVLGGKNKTGSSK